MTEKYKKTESWELEDSSVGENLPLPVIVEKEGGWGLAENIRAAMTYVKRCKEMKGKWCIYNDMTDRPEYLYVRKCHKETFSRKWASFLESAKDKDIKQRTEPSDATTENMEAEKEHEKPSKKPKKDEAAKPQKKEISALSKALKLKKDYQIISSEAQVHCLVVCLWSDVSWIWSQVQVSCTGSVGSVAVADLVDLRSCCSRSKRAAPGPGHKEPTWQRCLSRSTLPS